MIYDCFPSASTQLEKEAGDTQKEGVAFYKAWELEPIGLRVLPDPCLMPLARTRERKSWFTIQWQRSTHNAMEENKSACPVSIKTLYLPEFRLI